MHETILAITTRIEMVMKKGQLRKIPRIAEAKYSNVLALNRTTPIIALLLRPKQIEESRRIMEYPAHTRHNSIHWHRELRISPRSVR